MISIRTGVMIIGDSLVGKTSSYKVLIEAINEVNDTGLEDDYDRVSWRCYFPSKF